MKKIRQLIFSIARRFSEDKVTVYGAQASFFLMVSLGPFSIALAAMIQFFLPGNQWETLQAVLEYVPEQVSQVARIGINEIFTSSAPSIISISIILAIWSASRGFSAWSGVCTRSIAMTNDTIICSSGFAPCSIRWFF